MKEGWGTGLRMQLQTRILRARMKTMRAAPMIQGHLGEGWSMLLRRGRDPGGGGLNWSDEVRGNSKEGTSVMHPEVVCSLLGTSEHDDEKEVTTMP
jgi:hypothetical protein